MQLRNANVDRDIYFWPIAFKHELVSAQLPMNFKEVHALSDAETIEDMTFAKQSFLWYKNLSNGEKCFVGFIKII